MHHIALSVGIRLLGVWLMVESIFNLGGLAYPLLGIRRQFLLSEAVPAIAGLFLIAFSRPLASCLAPAQENLPSKAETLRWKAPVQPLMALYLCLGVVPWYLVATLSGVTGLDTGTPDPVLSEVREEMEMMPQAADEAAAGSETYHGTETWVISGDGRTFQIGMKLEASPATVLTFNLWRLLLIACVILWLTKRHATPGSDGHQEEPSP